MIWSTVPEIYSKIYWNFRSFFVFLPPKHPKNQNLKKWKTLLEISSFYTCVPKTTIIRCMVPEIWRTLKIKILKTWKKAPGGIIILYKRTKNHDHMLHCSLDMARSGCNYFPFCGIFCPFTLLTAQKIKIFKNWKKHLEISSFYINVLKIMIRWCTVPDIWCLTDVIISHFGLFFTFLPPNSQKNQNFEKMRKTPGNINILHMCTKNYDQMMYLSWDMVSDRCNYFSFWVNFYLFTP